jgi:CheY-like chemotaxis protein
MTPQSSTILWVDDDGPRRFPYEQGLLERDGWQVQFAEGIGEAVEALSKRVFLAVLLDQTLPMGSAVQDRANVWQGCRLLYWLRNHTFPGHAPVISEWERVGERKPHKRNRKAAVILVSGYYDPEVDAVIRALEPEIQSIVKPIDADALAVALRPLLGG